MTSPFAVAAGVGAHADVELAGAFVLLAAAAPVGAFLVPRADLLRVEVLLPAEVFVRVAVLPAVPALLRAALLPGELLLRAEVLLGFFAAALRLAPLAPVVRAFDRAGRFRWSAMLV